MADDFELGAADFAANPEQPVAPRLRESLLYGVQQQPDLQARMRDYARRLGVPLPAALGDPEYVKPRGEVERLDPNGMVLGAPRTANWLAEPDNAAIAHDDVPQLTFFEQAINTFKAAGLGFTSGARGAGYALEKEDPIEKAIRAIMPESWKAWQDRKAKEWFEDAMADRKRSEELTPKSDNPVVQGVVSGVVSLAQQAPLYVASVAARNPAPALAGMSAITGGNAYLEATEKGKSHGEALEYGIGQGTIEAATEMLGVGKLIGDIKLGSDFGQTLLNQIIREAPMEQAATILQDYNEAVTLYPEKTFGEYLAERPGAALSTLVATVVGVGGNVTVSKAVDAAVQAAEKRVQRAQAAQQTGEFLGELGKAAEASALRTRDPQTFHDYVAAVAQDTPIEFVYMQAQDLVDVLAGGSPDALAQNTAAIQAMPSLMDQIEEALPGNGLVQIPISELLAFTPETSLAQDVIQHLKIDPNGMSMAEAEAFMQDQAETLKAEVAKAVEAGVRDDIQEASRQAVKKAISDQLNTVNRFTPDVNETYAELLAGFYATTASKLGVTPEEFAAQHPVTFQAAGVGGEVFASSAKAITETPEFKAWFGDSKVVDAGGQPQVVYHGTDADFDAFDPSKIGTRTDSGFLGAGFYFASDPTAAGHRAKSLAVHLSIQNPLTVQMPDTRTDKRSVVRQALGLPDTATPREVTEAAKAAGHDGVVLDYTPSGYPHREIVAFEPTQIKSVENAGGFDPSDPNIYNQSDAHWNYEPGLGFHSALFKTVMEKGQKRASADQWLATLKNAPGVKKEELEWIGLEEGLKVMEAQNGGPVTREQVLAYIAQNGVYLDEVRLGSDVYDDRETEHFAEENEDGEWVVYGPNSDGRAFDNESDAYDYAEELNADGPPEGFDGAAQYADYQAIKGGSNYRELLLVMPRKPMLARPALADGHTLAVDTNARLQNTFTARMGHWDHDNVLAHTRLADFTTPDGKKVLGVLEIQSDWHQKGRDKGYARQASPADLAVAEQRVSGANATLETALQSAREVLEELPADVLAEARSRSGIIEGAALAEVRSDVAIYTVVRNAGQLLAAAQDAGTPVTEEQSRLREARETIADAQLRLNEAYQAAAQLKGEGGIPDAPFKSTWPALVMKRIIREAAEKGYDMVAWATGEQQADLYDMREQVGRILVRQAEGEFGTGLKLEGQYEVRLRQPVAQAVVDAGHGTHMNDFGAGFTGVRMTAEKVREVFGADLGGRMLEQADALTEETWADYAELSGDDLRIGGEGHKAFYNRNLVNITNDIVKKLGAKVGVVPLRAVGVDVRRQQAERGLTPEEDAEHTRILNETMIARQALDALGQTDLPPTDPEYKRQLSELTDAWQAKLQELDDFQNRTLALKQWGFEVTPQMREAFTPALFQAGETSTVRGTFNPSNNTITLLRNADLSTTLHELGHFFLETLARLAAEETAPQQIKDDWKKASEFIGFGGVDPAAWLGVPVDGRREGHEKWARGFEAYLREGKAPSQNLKGPFRRFKAWLVHVYKSITQLNVELTDEVRGVFDRLVATEEEIAKAEAERSFTPVFATRPDGMGDAEWEAYQRLAEDATATAQEELASRSIRDMRWLTNQRSRMIRELTREARERLKATRAEVQTEVLAEPVYAAQQFLRRGVMNGEPFDGPHKLSAEAVAAIYEGTPAELRDWKKLGYGRYGMLAEDGLDPDQVAELFGFSSGHELVEALLNAEPMREVIDGRTDQRMLERYGDLTSPEAIERAADEAIHNDVRLRFVATEAAALAKASGKKRILAEAARDFARDLVGRQRIRDIKPGKYTGAETRAATASAVAAAKGDLATAATEKRNQLINGYAAKAAYEALGEVEKALRYFERLQSATAKLDPDYRDQIDALLERFDLRKGQSLKAIDKRKSLAAWIEAQRARGLDPVIDESLANEAYRKHYKDMTADEMRGLLDAVRNIAHLGRLKHRLLVAARGRAFQAVVDEAEQVIRDNAYRTLPDKIEHNTVADRVISGFGNFFAIHRKLASLMREMAGLKHDGSVLWSAFVQPLNAANDKEAVMRERATVALADIFKPIAAKKGELRKKLFIPAIGRSLTLEGRLAVALNWGNELNRARIMDGDRWTEDQVGAVLATLTPDQLGFVNRVWEYLDSYWPEIAAKERRVTGVEPEKVNPEPFELTAADGTVVQMRGGYYPIKYDTERSSRSEADELAESVRAALRGAYTRATTRRGHTKARVDKVERPVRKDLLVPFQHVNQVIHDLAFHEYLIDANRLISAPQIDAAIRDHYGVETLRTIKKTLDDIAEGDQPAQDSLERAVNYVRIGTTITGLGWNLTSGLLQPLGLTQSIVRVGPKYMAKGIGMAFRDAVTLQNTLEGITAKSDFMRLRAKTFLREVNEVQNQVQDSLKPAMWGPVEGTFFILIQKLQLVADVPTWLGAYHKALDQGHDDTTAVGLADQAVRDSQGGGQIGDLAQIQRGSVWLRLWTNFYSFFNVTYNQMAESVAETRRVGPGRLPLLAADVLLLAVVPAVMGELLKTVLRGGDLDWEELAPELLKAEVSYLLGFMVGLRELGMVGDLGVVAAGGEAITQNAGRGPASLRLLTSDLPKLIQQTSQGEADAAWRKAAVNTAGILFHFPAGQINRTWDGIEALAKGDTQNPLALAFGPPRE